MKVSDSKTLWAKIGQITDISCMCENVILFGQGCIIQFINISNGEEQHLVLNSRSENGDGVKCVSGHPNLYLFAYVENCNEPYIYVKTYPDFEMVAKFPGYKEGCKWLEFSDSTFLFALSDLPYYTLTGWNWRTKEKFTEAKNTMLHDNQKIKCCYGIPIFMVQIGIGSHNLLIWDVFTVCSASIFTSHKVKISANLSPAPFVDATWSQDNICYVVDSTGSIYSVNSVFYLELVISYQTELKAPVSICWYMQGLTVYGPNQEIRHYKKLPTGWECDWKYSTEKSLEQIVCNRWNHCIAITSTYEIMHLGPSADNQNYVKQHQSNFLDICLINPMGEYIAALSYHNTLTIFNVILGNTESKLPLQPTALSMAANPLFPCLAIGLDNGNVQLVSVYIPQNPSIILILYLTDHHLTTTRYFESGSLFVTGNQDVGEFFIIRGLPGNQIEVASILELNKQIVDYFLIASQNMMRFFALVVTSSEFYAGNKIIRYCLVDGKVVNIKEYMFEQDGVLYSNLSPKLGTLKDKMFYIVPLHERHLYVANITRGSHKITLGERITTGHQIRKFSLNTCKETFFITWGYDGFVFVRSADCHKVIGIALPHHRSLQGVQQVVVTPTGKRMVSLGVDNVLVATEFSLHSEDEELKQNLDTLFHSTKMEILFNRPTLGFVIEERFSGKSWKEIERLKIIENEEVACKVNKQKIWEDFHKIQNTLKNLIVENSDVPDNKKLDLQEFYLNTASYNIKYQKNKEECKATEAYLNCLIVAQDKLSKYIIENYWEPMGVHWDNVFGMFSELKATNYCLLPENEDKLKQLSWINEQRHIEQLLTSNDSFKPWSIISEEKMAQILSKKPVIPKKEYLKSINLDQNYDAESEKSLETKIALAGSVAPLFIDVNLAHYEQRETTAFYHGHLQQTIAEREVIKLKQQYNKCFSNTKALKEREMYNVKTRNDRLRYILSEYNYFSENKVDIAIEDPRWQPQENAAAILKVTDEEIPVKPYISPSEQALLDIKAAEEERLRLLLLADDFRERALMNMMNGVLEVRWEDELKKPVPKPKCMIEKEPENFDQEDLRAVLDYEEKLTQQKGDIEKYKSMLESEFVKVATSNRDAIRKFNQTVQDCTKFKFSIDSGMNQENLAVNLARLNQHNRVELEEQELAILDQIRIYEGYVEDNKQKLALMQGALAEHMENINDMQAKEKVFEKMFKKDLQEFSLLVQEQSMKLYKKRPKVGYRNINMPTVLFDLAKCIISNDCTYAITQDSLDYLKSLEQLEQFSGLPPMIDETIWNRICKHRRIRIEHDIRIRACQVQILEGEATLAIFHRRIAAVLEKIVEFNKELDQLRAERLRVLHNRQIQIVLRRGLVEIPLTGHIYEDFQDAVLIPKAELEHINDMIIKAGNVKVAIIKKNMHFRRTIKITEWEHTKLKMKVDDLLEQKKDIEHVKFTRDMQIYLKNKCLGRNVAAESVETELEMIAARHENYIKDKKDKYRKIIRQLKSYKDHNELLDKTITETNFDLCQFKIEKDWNLEAKEKEIMETRLNSMVKRNSLVQKVQENHNEILVLQTELELLRLRTFPTFKYNILNE